MNANSREHFRQAIDAEIKLLEESIRVLKFRRNAHAAVSSLPPEVLAAIFSILCLPGTSSIIDGKPDHHLSRLRVSHVCHQWRNIALNHSLLWSHVNFTTLSSSGAAEILVRAKSAPLYLEASFSGHDWDDVRYSTFQKELQARIPHIRQLKTSAGPMGLYGILRDIVSPLPTLEYLSLSACDIYRKKKRAWVRTFIPDTLFNGSTPRLSCLELSYCDISWNSPLLKGLKSLEILSPTPKARPELAVWLGALDEMPQLATLTLHSASPIAPISLGVGRTVTLPSLTRLDILADPRDCALALAHLDLPALTWLCLTAIFSHLPDSNDLQNLLPHVVRHAHGPQDIQPLQSVLICSIDYHADILAWPMPDIDIEVHDSPTLLAMTRVALSFRSDQWMSFDERLEVLDTVMAGLPLEGLVTLATHDENITGNERDLPTQDFWHHLSPKWPLLKRVRLAPFVAYGFTVMVTEDDGGREKPLLPSLTELSVVDFSLSWLSDYPLNDALMKRVEQGVPVETLDLSMCTSNRHSKSWFRSLTELVVDILGPEESCEERERIESMWKTLARGPFVDDNNFGEGDNSDTGSDDED